jgi:hypothetical protein
MGPRVMRRLPRYVHGFIDRHGKARFYFRRAGFKKIALPGCPCLRRPTWQASTLLPPPGI